MTFEIDLSQDRRSGSLTRAVKRWLGRLAAGPWATWNEGPWPHPTRSSLSRAWQQSVTAGLPYDGQCSIGHTLELFPRSNRGVVAQYRKPCSRVSWVWNVPVSSSLLSGAPASEVPAGDNGTIQHSMHGKMDVCCHGGEFDKVGKPWTERALFNINRWAMVFPSDYLLVWKSKSKINVRVWTIIIALNVVGKTVRHWTRMSALNSRRNTCCSAETCLYIPIHKNIYLIHTAILITI